MSRKIQEIYTVGRSYAGYDGADDRDYWEVIIDSYWVDKIDAERRKNELNEMDGEYNDWMVDRCMLFKDYEQFENRYVKVEEQTDED